MIVQEIDYHIMMLEYVLNLSFFDNENILAFTVQAKSPSG